MKVFLRLLLLFIFPFFSFAQSNFHPGYIVTLKGDTVNGFIDYKERSINPVKVVFKPQKDSQTQVFTLNDCTAFGINQLETYHRFVVAISMSKDKLSALSIGLDTTSRTDTVFLKVLQSGKYITLYGYEDLLKTRFYSLEKGSFTPQELERNIYLVDNGGHTVKTDNKFIRQLVAIKSRVKGNEAIVDRKWMAIRYTENALIKVAAEINEQEIVKTKQASTRFLVGTGISWNKAIYSGDQVLAKEGTHSKDSYLPFLTFGLDYFANPTIRKLVYRAEFSLFGAKYESSSTTTSSSETVNTVHVFNRYNAQFTPQVIYNFYNADKLKFFASAGISLNYSIYNNNIQTTSYTNSYYGDRINIEKDAVDFEKFNYSIGFHSGVVINKRLELSAGYSLPTSITNYLYHGVKVQRVTFGVNFLFGKH